MRRDALALLAGLSLGLLAGCLDLGQLADVAFPPSIAGLPAGDWVSLPVGLWLTEGDVTADAIAFCAAPGCPHDAVVGLFTARGREAGRLADLARHPEALATALVAASRTKAGDRRSAGRRSVPEDRATVRREGAGFGLALDGRRPVWSEVRVSARAGATSVLMVIGDDAANVRTLVTEVEAATFR